MGLNAPLYSIALALFAWLLGQHIMENALQRAVASGLAAFLCVLGLVLQGRIVRTAPSDRRGAELRVLAALALVSAGASAYGVLRALHGDVLETKRALLWAAPTFVGAWSCAFALASRLRSPFDASALARSVRAGGSLAVLLLSLGLLNHAARSHDVRIDLSYRRAIEPSGQVRSLLAKLPDELEVVLLYEPHNEVTDALAPYFEAFSAHASRRVRVRSTDAAAEPDLLRAARVRGNGHVVLSLGSGARKRYRAFRVGSDLASARSTLRALDAHVARHLSALLIPERRVYLTYGHEERSVAGSAEESRLKRLSDLEDLLARFNIRLVRFGLAEGLGRALPADASLVMVIGPQKPFLAEEEGALEAYLERGGRLFLALDPGLDAGLGRVLARVGVRVSDGVAVCKESHLVRTRTTLDREFLYTNELSNHRALGSSGARAKELALVFVRSAGLSVGEVPSGVRTDVLVRSERDCFFDMNQNRELDLAEREASLALVTASSTPSGRVVVLGDGDFVTNQVLRNDANTLLTLDLVRFLLGDEALRAEVPPDGDLPIEHRKAGERAWFYGTTFAVPFALSCAAAALSRRRRRAGSASV